MVSMDPVYKTNFNINGSEVLSRLQGGAGQGNCREFTRRKSKSDAVVKHQRTFVALKTTSNVKRLFKSGAAPLYCSLVTSLELYAVESTLSNQIIYCHLKQVQITIL